MTLLEITIVILVLMSLVSVLFVGAQAWKRGSDRALCIVHHQTIQKAVRSYSNIYGHNAGDNVAALRSRLVGFGTFVEHAPVCPGGGTYIYGQTYGTDTIPPLGQLYLTCSLDATRNHVPGSHADW